MAIVKKILTVLKSNVVIPLPALTGNLNPIVREFFVVRNVKKIAWTVVVVTVLV